MFFGKQPKKKRALFLTGGGARGAYQAGVLKAISEIAKTERIPFDIISGMSAGSINSAFVVSRAQRFQGATLELEALWKNIKSNDIFDAKMLPLLGAVFRTILEVTTHVTPKEGQFFLDTSPLSFFLKKNIDYESLNRNIENELIDAFELSTVCYESGEHVSFYNSKKNISERTRFRYKTKHTLIDNRHVMASSALPLFFKPIKIDHLHYGDGALRNFYPLRSAVSMGADSFLIIDVKEQKNQVVPESEIVNQGASFGRILNLFFNTVFLDSIDRDLEMLTTINKNVAALRDKEKAKLVFREIDVLVIRPSEDLGQLATEHIKALPILLRHLLKTFGSKRQSADIISYLLFEKEYCRILVDLGYSDAMKKEEHIRKFLAADSD